MNTSIALNDLRNCIGYDDEWRNNYGVAVPVTIPKNVIINSMKFTINLTAYSIWQYSAPQNSWQIWISTTRYETTGSVKHFSTVTNNTPNHTFKIDYYTGDSNKTRTIDCVISNFNWSENTT